ncbi:MAG: DUF393 domain-containing protein [Planctomycetaceae bacterium]|nr:DUF393 domain-containing protein [Planctomycetaceae bacterium]
MNKTASESNGINHRLTIFYDGDCPLCRREIEMIRGKDKKNHLGFVDISNVNFCPEEYGQSKQDLMAVLHARKPNGEWITGVEVFREMYSAIGWSSIVWLTRLPVIKSLLDAAYSVFARNRLWITGRKSNCNDTLCGRDS